MQNNESGQSGTRIIGIRHRVKQTADGEARPTQLAIMVGGVATTYDLEDDNAELDWVLGRLPITYRPVAPGDDLSSFLPHHLKVRKVKKDELVDESRVIMREGTRVLATQVPSAYDGLRASDSVVMVLGGSGDRLAYAISQQGENVGAILHRLPAAAIKTARGEASKDHDAVLLTKLFVDKPDLFYPMSSRDRDLVLVREKYRQLQDAMKARLACEQRLRQLFIGAVFCNPEGLTPEGELEHRYEQYKASDKVFAALMAEEKQRERELTKVVAILPVYNDVLSQVTGVGPRIAARIITGVQDIRRFMPEGGRKTGMPKLKAFMGVHLLGADGEKMKPGTKPEGAIFPRRRHGQISNWHPDARQALYLLGDQFNRRPDSVWGQKLLEYKRKLREKYPEPVMMDNSKGKQVKRYTDSHIHKMATWKTLAKFVEWLWREWSKLERGPVQVLELKKAA